MIGFVYDDEDNVPMNQSPVPEPKKGCWCCMEYDGDRCHKEWNNNDDCYYIPCRDDKDPDDICETFELDEQVWRDGR